MYPSPSRRPPAEGYAELDPVARIYALLAIEWEPVGVFGNGDMGEQRLARQAAFDQMTGSRRLRDALLTREQAYFGRRVTITLNRAGVIMPRVGPGSPRPEEPARRQARHGLSRRR